MAQSADELIPTRTTLLHRLKDWQDRSSWQDFFDTYSKLIYNVALKSGLSEEEAKDVLRETVISVAKQMPTFKYDRVAGSFKAWLLTVTRWRITDQLQRHRPSGAPDAIVTNTDPVSQHFDALWDVEWEKILLNAAIANVKRRLDPQKYQIFDFYVNKGWLPEKVAESFSVSVENVYSAKSLVTEMIAEEIKKLEMQLETALVESIQRMPVSTKSNRAFN
ncbi:MAG: sigma-70 family RNA polymerase sigma factor [Limisphaerales bacterium]